MWIYFLDLAQFKDLLSNQRMELSRPTLTNQFLLVTIEIFECLHEKIDVVLHDSTNAIWFGNFKRFKSPPLFCLDNSSSWKNFNSIVKDANILHLKSNNNSRPNYFPIFTPSKHTHHRNGWPIISNQLLKSKVFGISLFLIPLYIFQVNDVFINKVLQGFDDFSYFTII